MLNCFICKTAVAVSVNDLFGHFKSKHGLVERSARYDCCQNQCCRTFSEKYAFSRHLAKCHKDDIGTNEDVNFEQETVTIIADVAGGIQVDVVCDNTAQNASQTKSPKTKLKDMAMLYICEAKSCVSTLENVNYMVNACSDFVCCVLDNLLEDVLEVFKTHRIKDNEAVLTDKETVLTESFNKYRKPFEGIDRNYNQISYLKQKGVFVDPIEFVIGHQETFIKDKKSGIRKPIMKAVTGQYISIKSMITALNINTDIVRQALQGIGDKLNSNPMTIESFFDGNHWQQHPLKGSDVLVLRLYGDDFEPGNPLGPHKAIYKIGCVYYQFENLPSAVLSSTLNMFLSLCYHTDDVKQFSWSAVYKPLVQELLALESVGMDLTINGEIKNVKVVLGPVTGDNLFLNGLLGYVESFSANYPCRHCVVKSSNFSQVWSEDKSKLRTTDSYDASVNVVSVGETGIKAASVLNDLKYFHAVTNFVQDIMHDLFEGVCAYDMCLVSRELIRRKFFTLSILNSRVQGAQYSYHEICNKPPVLSSLDCEMLPFDASEAWCFTCVYSVAVGHLVPEDDDVWKLYLCLRSIMDIVLAPSVLADELNLLEVMVAEYLEMRHIIFPEVTAKSKHHSLTHYPRLIREIGPLSRLWCMRFESKHQRYKRLMHISGNFKNVPKSVAMRHQHDMANYMLRSRHIDERAVVGPGSSIVLAELWNGQTINEAMGSIGLYFDLYHPSWVSIRGTKYKRGCYLLARYDYNSEMPQFVQVEEIFVRDHGVHIYFVCEVMETVGFDSHYHSWRVKHIWPKLYTCVNPYSLSYYVPVALHYCQHSQPNVETEFLIPLKHRT